MKSHPYATKRSLTNICCLIACLALIKLAFAFYIMSGGKVFDFTAQKKEISPKAAIIAKEHEQRKLAALMKAQGLEPVQVSVQSSNQTANDNTASNVRPSQNIGNTMADNNFNGQVINRTVSTGNSISFLPKSQNVDDSDVAVVAEASVPSTVSEMPATSASNAETANTSTQNPQAVASAEAEMLDISELSSDIILASASAMSVRSNRERVRQEMMGNTLSESMDNPKDTNLDVQLSNYTRSVATPERSFFSLVNVAHAADVEDYQRPDQQINLPVPTPTVNPYTSPDSLEYRQKELTRKEEELFALEQQMKARMEELNQLEGRIDNMVESADGAQSDKFRKLTNMYINMKARTAAEALSTLDEKLAVNILAGMKGKQAGEIFSYMDPIQAARLSEAIAKITLGK